MSIIYEDIKDRIEYAKRSYPYHTREMLYEQKGRMDMAARLGAITHTEHMELNKMCVAEGINNPKYFERGE